jgi:hypothetical protein
MRSTEKASRTARCTNVANCSKAETGEVVEWYPGAGEYCPDCGEALAPAAADAKRAASIPVVRDEVPAASSRVTRDSPSAKEPPPPDAVSGTGATPPHNGSSARAAEPPRYGPSAAARKAAPTAAAQVASTPASAPLPAPPPRQIGAGGQNAARTGRRARFIIPLRWFWIVAAAVGASAAIVYAARPVAMYSALPADGVTVCPVSSAPQLAADLVRGYAAKNANRANHFVLSSAKTCDVRFSMTPETPDDVIAHDAIVAIVNPRNPISRISETELRLIFSRSIHDWSELGMAPGEIVPVLPGIGTDEAKALESSLLFGFTIDRSVRRGRSSVAVAQAVMGNDPASRNAIGLVTFSQAGAAKVVPLAYLPAPSVLSIAAGRYPYTLAIAVRAASAHNNAAAAGLVSYALSGDGAAIVVKNGLVPRKR